MSPSFCVLLCCTCILLLVMTRRAACDWRDERSSTQNTSTPPLLVTSILTDPLLMRRADAVTGDDEFEGFIPDFLEHLSRYVGFRYEISLVEDGKYGGRMANGHWNGMMGELTRNETDIAVPLTATSMRERVVDLSKPIVIDRIAAIIKKRHSTQFEIRSVDDLGRQSAVKYGVLANGANEAFYRRSRVALHERMWAEMSKDENRVYTMEEGLQRAFNSNDEHPWAFVSESTALIYAAGQRCDMLVMADQHCFTPHGVRYLSLATPIGSQFRNRLDVAVLELTESGAISRLQHRWWPAAATTSAECAAPLISLATTRKYIAIVILSRYAALLY